MHLLPPRERRYSTTRDLEGLLPGTVLPPGQRAAVFGEPRGAVRRGLRRRCELPAVAVACSFFLQALGVLSFGTGNAGQVCLGTDVHLFHHQTSSNNSGVMNHFWTTGSSAQSLAAAGLELRFSYAFDGESPPSVSFDPAKAVGQFHGAVNFSGVWTDGTRAPSARNDTLFTAGDKAGKNAATQGWWHQIRVCRSAAPSTSR